MEKRFGYYIFGGMLIGAILGLSWSVNGNPIVGIGIGALVGMAIGWFGVAYAIEKDKEKK